MNPFHSWQVCQILLKKKLQNLAFKLPPSHGSIVTFSTRPMHKIQFRAVLWRILFAVVKLCRQLCGNRGNPNNRIWAPGEIKLVKIRNSNSESWRPWALGLWGQTGAIHSMARSAHPLLYPSIHQFIYWPTYQHIPEERI